MDEQRAGSGASVTDVRDRRLEALARPAASGPHTAAAGADEVRARALLARALDGERVSGASEALTSDQSPSGTGMSANGGTGKDTARLAIAKAPINESEVAEEAEPTAGIGGDADAGDPAEPDEADSEALWRRVVGPRAAEDFQAVFERLNPVFVPSDDAAVHRRRLRWLRARRYGVAIAVAATPVPAFLPWIGPVFHGYSLAATYACLPQSLQVDLGFAPGSAAAVAFVPGLLLGRRCVRHFKAKTKVGFLLRVATFVLLIGALEFGPVFPYLVHLLAGAAP